jgi:hypothetical protein
MLIKYDDRNYIIKEQSIIYNYTKIDQNAELALPVTISHRITKNEQGAFIPVELYKEYILKENK